MNLNTEFTWEKAQQIVDILVFEQTGKHLRDIEIIILRGAWDNQTYEEIAEAKGYTSNYLSKDVGNKLWSNLSTAVQEKVSKKNFKAALQREWRKTRVRVTRRNLIGSNAKKLVRPTITEDKSLNFLYL